MKADMKWNIQPRDALGRWAKQVTDEIQDELYQYLEEITDEITDWMQENAVWLDRTMQAREALRADIVKFAAREVGVVMHYDPVDYSPGNPRPSAGMGGHYSFYLETMAGGSYSILGPALDEWGPRIISDIRAILGSSNVTRVSTPRREIDF